MAYNPGIFEPFYLYVRRQLNIRKALISHANKIKIGNYSFKFGVDADEDCILKDNEIAFQSGDTWGATGDGTFDLEGRGFNFATEDEYYDSVYENEIMNQTEYPEWMIKGRNYIMTVSNN